MRARREISAFTIQFVRVNPSDPLGSSAVAGLRKTCLSFAAKTTFRAEKRGGQQVRNGISRLDAMTSRRGWLGGSSAALLITWPIHPSSPPGLRIDSPHQTSRRPVVRHVHCLSRRRAPTITLRPAAWRAGQLFI